MNVNVNALVEEYRPIVKDDISVIKRQQLTARVDMHVKERLNVSNTIPSDITELGLIVIDTTAIRNELIEKHDVSIYIIIIINQKMQIIRDKIKHPKQECIILTLFFFFFLIDYYYKIVDVVGNPH